MPKHGKRGTEVAGRSNARHEVVTNPDYIEPVEDLETDGEDRDWGNGERRQPPHPRTRSAHSSD